MPNKELNPVVPVELKKMPVDEWIMQNWGKQFENPEQLQALANQYFQAQKTELWAINGLCVYLGVSRQKLVGLERNPEYTEVVGMIKTRLEWAMEKRNIVRGNSGDQFALKVAGWNPNPEVEKYVDADLTSLTDEELENIIAEGN